ncbi:glycosyltransferase family 4 protein [Pacificoceanicola onchidii]|uniref:glycosyltransferase family 4 protein n=1 Tax=Pacificoceanicola onchidii TaxID=2562685 RepID=UPI001455E78D|nr:glycosyltransferase family 4 protein [Pacificoceanicola onchidii]
MSRPAPDPRHLLFLLEGGEGYGVMRVWETLRRGLSRRGARITAVLLRDNPDLRARWTAQGVEVLILPSPTPLPGGGVLGRLRALGARGLSQMRLSSRLAGEIRARGVSDIILQSPLATPLASLAARQAGAGVRAFWMMPNTVSGGYALDLNRRIYRALFRLGPLIPVANSHHTDESLGAGRYPRHVLHLGIDTAEFAPGAGAGVLSRADLGIPEEAPLFGVFARLTPEKGQGVLVEALAQVRDAHVLICGGPLESRFGQELQARIRALGLETRVHLPGPQAEVVPWLALCDVALNTRLDPEPFGLSVIEAMAMGKPVLAHAAGGPSETIVDGQTGWLMSEPTKEAYAEGLRRALAERARWDEIGAMARAHVQEHFSEEAMLDGLVAIMEG